MRNLPLLQRIKARTFFLFLLFLTFAVQGNAQEKGVYALENPVTVSWLKAHLNKQSPKLILTPEIEKQLKQKLKTDPLLQHYHRYLQNEATAIMTKPLLKRELEGFRLLAVSREMVERMGILCMVYRLDREPKILKRIDQGDQDRLRFPGLESPAFPRYCRDVLRGSPRRRLGRRIPSQNNSIDSQKKSDRKRDTTKLQRRRATNVLDQRHQQLERCLPWRNGCRITCDCRCKPRTGCQNHFQGTEDAAELPAGNMLPTESIPKDLPIGDTAPAMPSLPPTP